MDSLEPGKDITGYGRLVEAWIPIGCVNWEFQKPTYFLDVINKISPSK